jgi:DNA-binding HxlR family transcriptional regulator
MRKQASTNTINKKKLEADCGIAYTISVIAGRWKLSILSFLLERPMRYSELRKKLEGISEKMLISQLRELESDGLIQRIVYPEMLLKAEYRLSAKGQTLNNLLVEMDR